MSIAYKKRLFAEAKNKGLSNTEAAKAAGYSPKTAAQAGSRLAKDEAVIKLQIEMKNPKNKNVKKSASPGSDPMAVLERLMADPDPNVALKAATALMPYVHQKKTIEKGKKTKKETVEEDAQRVATGRFGTLGEQSMETNKIQ